MLRALAKPSFTSRRWCATLPGESTQAIEQRLGGFRKENSPGRCRGYFGVNLKDRD